MIHNSISEIIKEALAALGNKGVISINMEHSCADCSQQPLYETRILLRLLELMSAILSVEHTVRMVVVDGIVMGPTVRINIVLLKFGSNGTDMLQLHLIKAMMMMPVQRSHFQTQY